MSAIRLEDLPFEERDPLELFGIVRGRVEPDLSGEFAVYGFATLRELVLGGADGSRATLRDALVLALHSPEIGDPNATPDTLEVELEVRLAGEPEPVSVYAPLGRFLDVRAADMIGAARDVVLALCNPRHLWPAAPRWLEGDRRLHFAMGDVVSWLDLHAEGGERIRLQAAQWHTLGGA